MHSHSGTLARIPGIADPILQPESSDSTVSESQRFKTEGVTQFWLESGPGLRGGVNISYRPAALVECVVNFRSLRAGLNQDRKSVV